MSKRRWAAMLLILLPIGCKFVFLERPTAEPADWIVDDVIVGEWTGDGANMAIRRHGKNEYEVETVTGGERRKFTGHLVRIGDDYFAEIFALDRTWWVLRIRMINDSLHFQYPSVPCGLVEIVEHGDYKIEEFGKTSDTKLPVECEGIRVTGNRQELKELLAKWGRSGDRSDWAVLTRTTSKAPEGDTLGSKRQRVYASLGELRRVILSEDKELLPKMVADKCDADLEKAVEAMKKLQADAVAYIGRNYVKDSAAQADLRWLYERAVAGRLVRVKIDDAIGAAVRGYGHAMRDHYTKLSELMEKRYGCKGPPLSP